VNLIPFGMLFEERHPFQDDALPPLEYDEKQGLTFVKSSSGESIPFVVWAPVQFGKTVTGMATKAKTDESDTDEIR
jgi:hypothetical protein